MVDDLAVAGAANLALKSAGVCITFLLTVCLARLLGPLEFGTYTVAIYVVTFAATLAGIGLPPLVTKEVAASLSGSPQRRIGQILSEARHRTSVVAIVVALFVAGAIFARGSATLPVGAWGIVAIACLVPVTALNVLRSAALRGLGRSVLADVPDQLVQPALMLLFVAAAYWLARPATASFVLFWHLAAAVVAMGIGHLTLLSQSPVAAGETATDSFGRAWMRGTWASAAFSVLALMEVQLSLYVLSWLRGPEPVAHFQAARQVVALVSVGLTTLNLPLQSRLAAAWAAADHAEAQRLTLSAARLGLWLALCSTIVLVPFAETVLSLYGPDYASGSNALRLLVLGQLINAAAGPCAIVLLMTGHHRHALAGVLAAVVVNALVAATAVPALGATGAALATAAGMVTWNAVLAYFAWKFTRLCTLALPSFRPRSGDRIH